MSGFPNIQSNAAGAIPVWPAPAPVGSRNPGVSLKGNVGTASATIIPAGTFSGWCTVQNTHATQMLYISFNATATTTDLVIASGQAFTLPFGFSNSLQAIGSGAATTYAIIGQ